MSISDKFNQYLPAVEISAPLRARIDEIYNIMKQLCPDSIEDVFISEVVTPEGRQYGSLFFFSPLYFLEAKQFLGQSSFDVTPLKKRVYYFEVQAFNYDFERANDNATLSVTVHFDRDIRGLLRASKVNCNFLKDIVLKYFKTNLVD